MISSEDYSILENAFFGLSPKSRVVFLKTLTQKIVDYGYITPKTGQEVRHQMDEFFSIYPSTPGVLEPLLIQGLLGAIDYTVPLSKENDELKSILVTLAEAHLTRINGVENDDELDELADNLIWLLTSIPTHTSKPQ